MMKERGCEKKDAREENKMEDRRNGRREERRAGDQKREWNGRDQEATEVMIEGEREGDEAET